MSGLPTVDAPCALCGSERAEPVWTTPDRVFAVPGLYTVVRCRECGLLYQRPRVRDEHLAACYPDHYPRHQEPSPRVPFKGSPARIRAVRRALASGLGYGGLRDSEGILKTGLPAYHRRPSSPPSRIVHQPADLGLPIACGGVAVYPGDIIVGDGDGVV